MKYLIALVLGLCCSAYANPLPTTVGLHLASSHTERGRSASAGDRGWNNHNSGIYAMWDNGATLGTFKNSLYRQSTYLGWTASDRTNTASLTLGVISGYDKLTDNVGDHQDMRCDSAKGCRLVSLKSVILPLLVPSIRIGITDKLSARLSLLAVPRQPLAAHLSLEWGFSASH
jgi:hypothetical protein